MMLLVMELVFDTRIPLAFSANVTGEVPNSVQNCIELHAGGSTAHRHLNR
jgi:hypothetical protein